MGTHQNRLDEVRARSHRQKLWLSGPRVIEIRFAAGLCVLDGRENSSRAPLGRMLRQIKKGIPRGSGRRGLRNLGTCFACDQAKLCSCIVCSWG